eukprot:scaffold87023_cov24-Tisochrysis_lutea.AAC.1
MPDSTSLRRATAASFLLRRVSSRSSPSYRQAAPSRSPNFSRIFAALKRCAGFAVTRKTCSKSTRALSTSPDALHAWACASTAASCIPHRCGSPVFSRESSSSTSLAAAEAIRPPMADGTAASLLGLPPCQKFYSSCREE